MDTLITPVLLTGGSGTRLWPVSRDTMPKQFLPLFGEFSTYQQTLLRVKDSLFASPLVMTSENFRFFVQQQARDVGVEPKIVLEPMRRDSAPAIIAAALLVAKHNPQGLLLVLAADHLIPETDLFLEACRAGSAAALRGRIVTFGIVPTEAKTSYGYIHPGAAEGGGVYRVEKFVEKPDAETAKKYVADGYLWNSGNFLFRVDVFLAEVALYQPEMLEAVKEAVDGSLEDHELGFMRLLSAPFERAPQKSIDYAIMERTVKAAVVEARFRWSDIGSWKGVYDSVDRDAAGNAIRGDAIVIDSERSLIHAERVTAVLGLKDIVVITTPDAVLVASRDRTEDVKKLVAAVSERGYTQAHEHRKVYRPWGSYEAVDAGDRFQVKRIVVLPGAMLSLQKHMHRAEHWVVVRGAAEVTVGESVRILHENESVYVPMGETHRLKNPGKIALELIEVQTGSYLGEDDITRLEDIYKR
jgi:mannose-1-phosphate guanylyltransferase/mannose-6-phosphate isomerase